MPPTAQVNPAPPRPATWPSLAFFANGGSIVLRRLLVAVSLVALAVAWALGAPEAAREDPLRRDDPQATTPEYDRSAWPHWIDADADCQNTRHELLIAESLEPVSFKARRPCKVSRGLWRDAYTGELIRNPDKLDVDHLVPLAEAHRSGGFAWPEPKRRAFANDLAGLVLTRRALNQSKGDQDPARWMPPRPELRCEYARRWIAIKQRWGLARDAREDAALAAACR